MDRKRIDPSDLRVQSFETLPAAPKLQAAASCTSPAGCSACCALPTCTCDC